MRAVSVRALSALDAVSKVQTSCSKNDISSRHLASWKGLLIGSQVLLSEGLSAFGLLPHHLRSSFTTQLLRRLVRIHAELFAGSSSDLEDREAGPRVVNGFLLGAIVVENVHRAIRASGLFITVIRTGSKYCKSMGTSENWRHLQWCALASHDDEVGSQLSLPKSH